MKLQIRRFDPASIKEHRIMLFVAKRGGGKTTALRDILHHIGPRFHAGVAMCPTEEGLAFFRSIMPKQWVYSDFSESTIAKMMELQSENLAKGKEVSLFLILDDCLYAKNLFKSTVVRKLFMNGRHYKITVLLTAQYLTDLTPDLRSNVDVVMSFREPIIANKQRLWRFFYGCFHKFDDFVRTHDKCTDNFGALVLDNTGSSNCVADSCFWYHASPKHRDIRLGKSSYVSLAKKTPASKDKDGDQRITSVEKKGSKRD